MKHMLWQNGMQLLNETQRLTALCAKEIQSQNENHSKQQYTAGHSQTMEDNRIGAEYSCLCT